MTHSTFRARARSAIAIALASVALSSAPAFAAPAYSSYHSDALPMSVRYADRAGNISEFEVEQPRRYLAGNRLIFTVRGEPRARVTVQMQAAGVNKTIALSETDRGVYEGAYTIRANENFARPTFRAQLSKNRAVSTAIATVDERALRQAERQERREDRMERREEARDYRRDARDYRAVCNSCGVVESVQVIDSRSGDNSPLGAISGAVVGGLLGNQVGGGSGRDLATIAGVIGGGFAGNEIARNQNGRNVDYILNIRMDNGQLQRLRLPENPNLGAGQRVRLDGNRVIPE